MISGRPRSPGVIDRMIASTRPSSRSSTFTPRISLPSPGIMPSTDDIGPIFCIIRCAWRKSSNVNWPARMRFSISACSSSVAAASAFSISVMTSPIPRIREAMRSGWNSSIWSSFSPVETSLIGLPVTARTESAAPPRASPSSFVSTTPSNCDVLGERLGDRDRVLAGHRVEDEEHVHRVRRLAHARELVHQLVVDVEPARRCRRSRRRGPAPSPARARPWRPRPRPSCRAPA